jgi:SSS family solute:Na+ symporter
VWSRLVSQFAPPGLLGVLVAAELAGYMAIANGFMNWGGSYLTNDIYKGVINRNATRHQLAMASKVSTVLIVCLSFLVTLFLVEQMMAWFLFINAVVIAFTLPLAFLRFFWWRFNIWGEAAGVLLGLPLGYLIWFPLGFSQRPFWEAFVMLFAAGWVVILGVTLLTPPEPIETLRRFYDRCRPAGLWGKVAAELPEARRRQAARGLRRDLGTCAVGIVLCASMVFLLNTLFAAAWMLTAACTIVMLVSGLVFLWRWREDIESAGAQAEAAGAA